MTSLTSFFISVLQENELRIHEWNKTLSYQLTDEGLTKLVEAGFTSSDDVIWYVIVLHRLNHRLAVDSMEVEYTTPTTCQVPN